MKRYAISFTAPEAMLQIILGCVVGEVEDLQVTEVTDHDVAKKRTRIVANKPTSQEIAQALRSRSQQLILKALEHKAIGSVIEPSVLLDKMTKGGYKATSLSAILTNFRYAGILEREGGKFGKDKLVKPTLPFIVQER